MMFLRYIALIDMVGMMLGDIGPCGALKFTNSTCQVKTENGLRSGFLSLGAARPFRGSI